MRAASPARGIILAFICQYQAAVSDDLARQSASQGRAPYFSARGHSKDLTREQKWALQIQPPLINFCPTAESVPQPSSPQQERRKSVPRCRSGVETAAQT